jgi:hypothetical protein
MTQILAFIATHMGFLWQGAHFRIVGSEVTTSNGGDAYLMVESDVLRMRFVRDRGQLLLDFQPSARGPSSSWFSVDLIRRSSSACPRPPGCWTRDTQLSSQSTSTRSRPAFGKRTGRPLAPSVERERVSATAMAARRSTQAGSSRVYLADTVLLLEAPDAATLSERVESLRLEGRGLGLDLEIATFRLADAWAAALPGPAPRPLAERNLDSASLAACLLHAASDLYEPTGHLYGRSRTSGAPIVLDRFAHASHNAIVLGQTGTGKTMFTGAEMSRCLVRGIRVLAVDPSVTIAA